jgi:tol-pal system protein YbgF
MNKQNQYVVALTENLSELKTQLAAIFDAIKQIQEVRAKEAAERAAAAAQAAKLARLEVEKSSQPRVIEPEKTKKKVEPGKTGARAEEAPSPQPKVGTQPTEKSKTKEGTKAVNEEKSLYDKGIAAFQDKKYKGAYNYFINYLEKYPKAKMVPNARFWLGECLYQQKEYELAILEYQKVIADFPEHGKAAAALLKQGLSFEKLEEQETAKIVYSKLISDYPKSDQVETAKKRLDALK